MSERYSTFYEMLKGTVSKKFLVYYYFKVRCFTKSIRVDAYQDMCRIYLDEYEEQKEIRKEWFEKNHDAFKHIYTRFLKRK